LSQYTTSIRHRAEAWRLASKALLFAFAVISGDLWAQEGASELARRRAAVEQLTESLEPARLDEVLGLFEDEDATTRGAAVGYLGEVELKDARGVHLRVEALASSARDDVSASVRRQALEALAQLTDSGAARALVDLARELPAGERARAALLLARTAYPHSQAARAGLEAAVLGAAGEGREALPPDVLAIWLPTYGRRLAEREGGGDLPRERAPIVLGSRHPSPAVRVAASRALEVFLLRLEELGRFERSARALERFATDGVATRNLAYLRVLATLEDGDEDPLTVLSAVRRLGASTAEVDSFEAGYWRAKSMVLEALARIAGGELAEAAAPLRRAGDLYDGLIARRVDQAGEGGAALQRDLYDERAMVEFCEVFRLLADGSKGDDLGLLQRLRGAHTLQLMAQLVARRADAPAADSPDLLFEAPLSPCRLVFGPRPHAAWPPARQLALRLTLGRAVASVSAREMPGFEPFPEVLEEFADPVVDPRRRRLMQRLTDAGVEALGREYERLNMRRWRETDPDPALESQIMLVSYQLRRASQERAEQSLEDRFYDLRRPSSQALVVAEALRREGRAEGCRALATRFYEDLETAQLRQRYTWGVALAAQAQLTIGGSFSDTGEPQQAEEHMLLALELYEGLKTRSEERQASGLVREAELAIADVLVSLAVNSNVKARDPERAREYFERAYELRQGDFMRVMLACYRARSGHDEEARELLEHVPLSPQGYYNLACTYALLGETQRALEYLERDFVENRLSPAALEKQKAWARGDPDLQSLREDPRFEVLTEATEGD
jgi:tetratricopeptide (TPR) repeat protein